MDATQYTRLAATLEDMPDPRHARGKRVEWLVVLGVIATALVSQQRSARAIAQWAHRHAVVLLTHLRPHRGRLPSESTIRRALQRLDVTALEQALMTAMQELDPEPPAPQAETEPMLLHGQAIDGKAVRGAGAHGQRTHLVSLVSHQQGQVLAQMRVPHKRNEITAVPHLLAGRDLQRTVITMDALLTQRTLAQQIVDQHGHYLMVVKGNQKGLYADLAWLFQDPPSPTDRDAVPWQTHTTVNKGHGRLETRVVTCHADLGGFLDWPGVQQVVRRTCERLVLKTRVVTRTVTYGLTSATPQEAGATQLAALWRGHWRIENGVHYVRDVTLGEDAGQMHVGHAPQVLAALRNAIISWLRWEGWDNIADALRYYNGSVQDALQFIGFVPTLT